MYRDLPRGTPRFMKKLMQSIILDGPPADLAFAYRVDLEPGAVEQAIEHLRLQRYNASWQSVDFAAL